MDHRIVDNTGLDRIELYVSDELVGWSEYRPAGDSVALVAPSMRAPFGAG